MSLLKFLRNLFKKKKQADIYVIPVAGKECPICGDYGLFHYTDYSRCEECEAMFDEQMNVIKRDQRPFRYRDDGGTDGG